MKQSTAANLAYFLYRAATRVATPAAYFLSGRRKNWKERLGYPSASRPPQTETKPLLWFHAVSLGEAFSALPLIHHCSESESFAVLMTTSTVSSFEVIKDRLPSDVIFQIAPIDTPKAVQRFLTYWNPFVIFLIESELWPNLILHAADKGIKLALLNARISSISFDRWSTPLALPLISLMLSKFSLISPLSNTEAVRFQLLGAPPCIIHFSGDLKYGVGEYLVNEKEGEMILDDIKMEIGNRPTWLAASIHLGEERVMLRVHNELIKIFPKLLLILVTRHPKDGRNIALALKEQKVNVALRSKKETISPNTSIYIVDTLGELRVLYRASEIAVIGGSFLPHLCGHNFSEAAAASAAVLTGPHIGHFRHMLMEMRRIDSLSVKQVGGEEELVENLKMLLSDKNILKAHKKASKHSFELMSKGVVNSVWSLVDIIIMTK
ncbi:hypothetical protein LUZ60_002745 [Juncus effusus]|nr:hypothetical protein LUZ60_002745 [Juncus effusus]